MKAPALAAALALVTLVGCSGTDTPIVHRADGTVLMAAASEPDAHMLAIVGGTLTRNDRGCVALADHTRGSTVVLFPFGTTLAEDGRSVSVPRTGVIRFGDQAAHGGGAGTLDGLANVPSECTGGTDLLVWD